MTTDAIVDAVVERLQPRIDDWLEQVEQDLSMMLGDEFDRLFRDRVKYIVGQTELLFDKSKMHEDILEKEHPNCVGEWEEENCEGGGSAPHMSSSSSYPLFDSLNVVPRKEDEEPE